MGRYRRIERVREERPWKIHPLWRGIGCVLILMIPILAYAGAVEFWKANQAHHWFSFPPFMDKAASIPALKYIPVLDQMINPVLQRVQYGHLVFTLIFMFIGFGFLSMLYASLYRVIGPPRYGAYDAPPVRAPRRRTR
jgi:hypothetical protein